MAVRSCGRGRWPPAGACGPYGGCEVPLEAAVPEHERAAPGGCRRERARRRRLPDARLARQRDDRTPAGAGLVERRPPQRQLAVPSGRRLFSGRGPR
jgi:hypothetical protein